MMSNPLRGLPQAIRDALVLAVVPGFGSLRDWSGTKAAITVSNSPRWEGTPITPAFHPGTDGALVAADVAALRLSYGTMFVAGKIQNTGANKRVICHENAGGRDYTWFMSPGSWRFSDSLAALSTFTAPERIDSAAVSFVNGAAPLAYANGAYAGTFGTAVTVTPYACPLYLGNRYNNVTPLDWPARAFLVANRVLIAREIATIHEWSMAIRAPGRQWNGWGTGLSGAPSTPTVDSLCSGAWDFGGPKMVGEKLPDLSGKGNPMALSPGLQFAENIAGRGRRFLGAQYGIASVPAACLGDHSVEMLVRMPHDVATIQSLVSYNNSSNDRFNICVQAGVVRFTNYDGSTFRGASRSGAIANRVHHIVATWTDSAQTPKIYLDGLLADGSLTNGGLNTTVQFTIGAAASALSQLLLGGEVMWTKVRSRVLTQAEVTARWEAIARRCTFDSYSDSWRVSLLTEGGTVGQRISNTPFLCGDSVGRWKVVDDPTVPGGRAIQIVTAGACAVPVRTQDFGTWEMWVLSTHSSTTYAGVEKTSLLTAPYDGFHMFETTGGTTALRRAIAGATGSLVAGSAGLSANQWHGHRFSRRLDSLWTYHEAMVGQPWVLRGTGTLDSVSFSGTKWLYFKGGVGDRIALVRRYLGEVLP